MKGNYARNFYDTYDLKDLGRCTKEVKEQTGMYIRIEVYNIIIVYKKYK